MDTCKHGLQRNMCAFCTKSDQTQTEKPMDNNKTAKSLNDSTKECSRCHVVKPLYEFGPDSKIKSGKRSYCRACANEYAKRLYMKRKNKKVQEPDIGAGSTIVKKILEKAQKPSVNKAPTGDAERLASEHWAYVVALLTAHLEEVSDLSCMEFHYKTAFVHGYKHGLQAKQ